MTMISYLGAEVKHKVHTWCKLFHVEQVTPKPGVLPDIWSCYWGFCHPNPAIFQCRLFVVGDIDRQGGGAWRGSGFWVTPVQMWTPWGRWLVSPPGVRATIKPRGPTFGKEEGWQGRPGAHPRPPLIRGARGAQREPPVLPSARANVDPVGPLVGQSSGGPGNHQA